MIVIPPGGLRDDGRVVQADLEVLEAAEIAARLELPRFGRRCWAAVTSLC